MFDIGREFIPNAKHTTHFPPGSFMRVCTQERGSPAWNFGVYDSSKGNPTAAYTEDGRDGYTKLFGKHFVAELKWDYEMMAPPPDDLRMVCVELFDYKGTSLLKFGWMLIEDMVPRPTGEDADAVTRRIGEAKALRVRELQTKLANEKRGLEEAVELMDRNIAFLLRQIEEKKATNEEEKKCYLEQIAKTERELASAIRDV